MIGSLRPYQAEVFDSIARSIALIQGLTLSVEIARQGGKNELSAHVEMSALAVQASKARNIIKCSPTFEPQAVISMTRLKDHLDHAGFGGLWSSEHGYIIRLGKARIMFLSAAESSRVVGHTAHLLLEVDEAQDIDREKYSKEFKPMAATTNATTVLYGTAWDDSTLLEEVKQVNLDLEKRDGIKRHFRYDWQEIAKYNADYLAYVEGERQRLGEDHPLFRTQYRLLPVRAGGGFFSPGQRSLMQGDHPRLRTSQMGRIYVAGIDLAGEAEELKDRSLTSVSPSRDATVVTIAEIDVHRHPSSPNPSATPAIEPSMRIVDHFACTGQRHSDIYRQLVHVLKNVWHCRKVVVDSTGVGEPVYSFLRESIGSVVSPFSFTAVSKSQLGFSLLAAVNSGRLKVYRPDGSRECQAFWTEMEKAKSFYRPSQTLNFFVDPSEGHDDFLMSLALTVEAATQYEPKIARGTIRSGDANRNRVLAVLH